MIKVDDKIIESGMFPDGTLSMKFDPEALMGYPSDIEIEWKYENDAEIFKLICIKRKIDEVFDKTVTVNLFMPYIPNARMDRVKNDEDVFTLKYFADIINSLNFDNVICLEPHSSVSTALINNIKSDENTLWKNIERIINERETDINMLFYPDEGCMKRMSEYKFPSIKFMSFGMKKRDWKTGEIQGLDIFGDNVKGKNILIVDDICSKGGTFYWSAKKLKELGAKKICLYVSHCENTIEKGELLKDNGLIDKIYTTDTICTVDNPKLVIFKY